MSQTASLAPMRAMRERFRAALRRGLIGVLDIGSSKTCCLILRVDAQRLQRAHQDGALHDALGALRVVGAGVTRSRGVRLGEIADMEEACRAIRTALELAEKMVGERVDQVVVGLSGGRPESGAAHAVAMLEGLEAADRDVARVVTSCRIERAEGRETLHAQPVNFALDGVSGLNDPRGMSGKRIACDMHVVSVAATPLRNLAACVRRCDLELAGVVCASYASGLSALVEDEQKLGAACIDMGAGSTGLSVFLRGHLIHADSVRVGGDHITHDIATGLAMPSAAAERIKTLHGGAVATGLDDREMIEAPRLGEFDAFEDGEAEYVAGDRRRISRAMLIGVIRPRLEEILETARDRLRAAGFEHLPGRRIVLTGGASQLAGLEEAAQRILGRRARIGRPIRLAGLPPNASGPDFATAVGLCALAARPQDEMWDFDAPLAPSGRGALDRAVRWFRDNW
ncbi:MAG: cell division protein FtsA [Rubrimonas sp.]|uniref:cell division protein FtsA n=1 Tax=Rubrimonas sp. TaxID=2036015 RepID=UPI002FDEED9D